MLPIQAYELDPLSCDVVFGLGKAHRHLDAAESMKWLTLAYKLKQSAPAVPYSTFSFLHKY